MCASGWTTPSARARSGLGGHRSGSAPGAPGRGGSNRPLSFNGEAGTTIPPGGSVRSDAVPMKVMAMQDLAVSLHLPEADVKPSQHAGALVTSYAAAANAGDRSSLESAEPFTETMTDDAVAESHRRAVGIGARARSWRSETRSPTACARRSTRTTAGRIGWRFDSPWKTSAGAADHAQKAVLNEGIGGNTVTREGLQPPPDSTPGVERLERDVLSHEGVTDVVLFMGTNDIRRGALGGAGDRRNGADREPGQSPRVEDLRRHRDPAPQRGRLRHEHGVE